jgi:hypothetical protein
MNRNIKIPERNCANKFSIEKRAYPALDVETPMETKRVETTPTRKSSQIASLQNDVDFAKFKVSTHMLCW